MYKCARVYVWPHVGLFKSPMDYPLLVDKSFRLESTDKYVHIDKNGAAANNNSFNVRVRADHVVLHFRARDCVFVR